MEQNFERAFKFAMDCEKYRSDDPRDPGGLTIWGISSRYYPMVVASMRGMSEAEALEFAKGFYRGSIWEAMKCDQIANPLDIVVFDTAIIPGPGAAKRFLGMTHDWKDYLFLRLEYFADSKSADMYLRGWVRKRIINLWRLARGF
jgi:lysozyme family protein